MGKGKVLSILGAIITSLGFLLFASREAGTAQYVYGLGGIIAGFSSTDMLMLVLQSIVPILFILLLFIGIKVRALEIIAGIWFLGGGIAWILAVLAGFEAEALYYVFMGVFADGQILVEGIIPIYIELFGYGIGVWIYTVGALLALIGGITNKSD